MIFHRKWLLIGALLECVFCAPKANSDEYCNLARRLTSVLNLGEREVDIVEAPLPLPRFSTGRIKSPPLRFNDLANQVALKLDLKRKVPITDSELNKTIGQIEKLSMPSWNLVNVRKRVDGSHPSESVEVLEKQIQEFEKIRSDIAQKNLEWKLNPEQKVRFDQATNRLYWNEVKNVSKFLKSKGIAHELISDNLGAPSLRILPGKNSKIGRFALAMQLPGRGRTTQIESIGWLPSILGRATWRSKNKTVFLDIVSILEDRVSISGRHELNHAHTSGQIDRGIQTPFQIAAFADGLSDLPGPEWAYMRKISFDEMRTFRADISQWTAKFNDLMSRGGTQEGIGQAFVDLASKVESAVIIHTRVIGVTKNFLEKLKVNGQLKATPNYANRTLKIKDPTTGMRLEIKNIELGIEGTANVETVKKEVVKRLEQSLQVAQDQLQTLFFQSEVLDSLVAGKSLQEQRSIARALRAISFKRPSIGQAGYRPTTRHDLLAEYLRGLEENVN